MLIGPVWFREDNIDDITVIMTIDHKSQIWYVYVYICTYKYTYIYHTPFIYTCIYRYLFFKREHIHVNIIRYLEKYRGRNYTVCRREI
jgi:hypothetical protein